MTTPTLSTAGKFARQRPHTLAKAEDRHDDGLPTVLFLCVRNARCMTARSMTEGV
jgi:hypothetical protein